MLVRLGNGYLFGEKALVDNAPRAATALVVEETELIYIEKKNFEEIKQNYKVMREQK